MNITLDLSTLYKHAARFDSMTLRERALISVAALAVVVVIWYALMMQSLSSKQQSLKTELDSITNSIANTATAMEQAMEPRNTAMAQLKSAQTELDEVDHQLSTTIAGMIAPEHMATVIKDVLLQQHGLTLISLRNNPVRPLITTPDPSAATAPDAATANQDAATTAAAPGIAVTTNPVLAVKTGPYVHPLELVVEGNYADIVTYLKALETLKWHVYWNRLELQTNQYPANRVQIEMSTLSLDDTWLGI